MSRERVIVALDVADLAAEERLLSRLGEAPFVKVGLELYSAAGPRAVEVARARGAKVFLDLKLHDIPETVARAVRSVAPLGVELLTIHASGGHAMMTAAVAAAKDSGGPQLLAITVLTSLDEADLVATGQVGPIAALVERRARLAIEAGVAGVVCSPHEAALVRAIAPADFLIVTPGVRAAGAPAGDQKRVATVGEAMRAGASHIVVGRPVRDAADPAAALVAFAAEIAAAS